MYYRIGMLLSRLLDYYKNNKIDYCILRNYQTLFNKDRNGDIDILIRKDFSNINRRILKSICVELRYSIFYNKKALFDQYIILRNAKASGIIQLDFFNNIYWWGVLIAPYSEILQCRKRYRDFFVPSDEYEAFITWLYPFISNGLLKDRYKEKISLASATDGFKNVLAGHIGEKYAQLIANFLKAGDFESPKKFLNKLRIGFVVTNSKARPLKLFRDFALTLFNTLHNYMKPKGLWIAILGPDGSGKTTAIDLLKKRFEKTVLSTSTFHWRPGIIPSISKLLTGVDSGTLSTAMSNPHKANPGSFFSSIVRLCYYSFDFLLGHFLKSRRRLYEGKLIIFDRYFHDFLVDPERSRIKLPLILPHILAKILPHPDIVFCLTTDARTILNRKRELTLPEIERQLIRYRRLCSKFSYCTEVDVTGKPDVVIQGIEKLIIEKWTAKFKKL